MYNYHLGILEIRTNAVFYLALYFPVMKMSHHAEPSLPDLNHF